MWREEIETHLNSGVRRAIRRFIQRPSWSPTDRKLIKQGLASGGNKSIELLGLSVTASLSAGKTASVRGRHPDR